jgi:hypothetical protein
MTAAARRPPAPFAFPESYRRFATQFGYGVLCNFLVVYVPQVGDDSFQQRYCDLVDVLRIGVDERLFSYEPDGSEALVRRLVPFCSSENGDTLAWDPLEQPSAAEYAIYLVRTRYDGVKRLCSSFDELVEICLDEGRARESFGAASALLRPEFQPMLQ